MRKIRFRSMSCSGFKVYRDSTTFDLAPGPGLHFLMGDNQAEPTLESNGTGKSSVWDLFCWILKGRTLDGLRSPDLQTWGSDAPIKGKLVFDCDNEPRTISRQTHPNSLQLDGDPVAQDAVDALFGNLSLEAIGHTIIHGQGREFFFDLVPAKKMELLSETLNLERWEARSAFAAARVAKIEQKIGELQTERSGLEGRREEIDRLLEEARQAQTKWNEELKDALKRIDLELSQEETQLAAIEKRRNEAKLANDGAGTEAVALERGITQLEVYWGETTRQLAEKNAALQSAETANEDATQMVQLIRESRKCPTCQQDIDRRRLLPAAQEKAQSAKEAVDNLRGEVRVLRGSETDLKQQLDEARSSLRRFRQRENDTQTTLNNVEPEMVRRQTKVRILREQKQQQSEAPNPHIDEVCQYRLRIVELQRKLKAVDDNIQRFTIVEERTRFWIKGFREVRLYVIKEALAQMGLLANAMLEESGLVGWSLEYVSERTTKSDTLKSGIAVLVKPAAADKPIRWESFSGGERQRLRLIGSRALAEVLLNNAGLQVNLEVFDEPTQALSPRGIEDLVEMLSEQARWSRKTIFCVDHHAIPSDRFTSVIRVVRTKDGSRVES
jgi:DNA repair exonuclease SbcCD ATPase subunit